MRKRGLLLLLLWVPAFAGDPGPGGIWKVGDRYRFEYLLSIDGFRSAGRPDLKDRWVLHETYEDTILAVNEGRPTRVSRSYLRFQLINPRKKTIEFSSAELSGGVVILEAGKRGWTFKRPAPKFAAPILRVSGSFSRWARLAEVLDDTTNLKTDFDAASDLLPRALVGSGKGFVRYADAEAKNFSDGRVWAVRVTILGNYKPSSSSKISFAGTCGSLVLDESERRVVSFQWEGLPIYAYKKKSYMGKCKIKMTLERLKPKK